jgi:hypothetical protein
MVQRRKEPGFALEPGESIGILCECIRQHLDGDLPTEVGVPGAPDFAHPARAKVRNDFVRAETDTRSQRHGGKKSCYGQLPTCDKGRHDPARRFMSCIQRAGGESTRSLSS